MDSPPNQPLDGSLGNHEVAPLVRRNKAPWTVFAHAIPPLAPRIRPMRSRTGISPDADRNAAVLRVPTERVRMASRAMGHPDASSSTPSSRCRYTSRFDRSIALAWNRVNAGPAEAITSNPTRPNAISRNGSDLARRGQDPRVLERSVESRPARAAPTGARQAVPDPPPDRRRGPGYEGMIHVIFWSFASGYVILARPARAVPGIAEGPNTVGTRSHGSCSSGSSPKVSRTCS